jgi:hypothetical protein
LEMTYNAVVGKIYTSPHPNADRLKIGHICGAVVVVSLDTQDGDLYAYFDCDGQLSAEFASANNLLRDSAQNADTTKSGFFEDNRRVRAQPFRGVKSEGFAVPLSYFTFTGYDISLLKEGDTFSELNKVPICQKYYTPATLRAMKGNTPSSNPYKANFPQHYDTAQFRYALLQEGDLIIVTEKEHGTSVRYGNVEVQKSLSLWDRVKNYFSFKGFDATTLRKEYVLGTRRAILPKVDEYNFTGGFYGSGEPYTVVPNLLFGKLRDNEVVYGEVVGYCKNGSPLFTHSLTKLPELEKQYGSPIEYSYGCVKGQSKFRAYRITHNGRDLSWFECQKRCEELGVEMVTEITRFVYNGNREELNAQIATYLEGSSLIDYSHIREGVCVRVENKHGHKVYKEKSYSFKVAEGIAKDSNDYIDSEEIS